MNPAIEQELTDACTSMEMARESANRRDIAMLAAALQDVRKRADRLLEALDQQSPAATIDPQLPTSPRLPLTDGEL
ncbi:MAG TPA: hypothetical protein VFO36_06830 [Nitrospiraceae bacterium]|nr:hypothetical protein [Nitrospiraceae bacterium]